MKELNQTWLLCLLGLLSGCVGINESSKHELTDGVYKLKRPGSHASLVYIERTEDSIKVLPLQRTEKRLKADSLKMFAFQFPPNSANELPVHHNFIKHSIDFDILTILFKYRPATAGFPSQLNTNLNGALYLGLRSDKYSLSYTKNVVNTYKRNIVHYGFSFGLFAGLGSTAMNPWVTNNSISSEYDGVVIPKGVAGIIGINNLTVGLTLGIDHLADKNKRVWLYQGKPWAGLSVGLNLN